MFLFVKCHVCSCPGCSTKLTQKKASNMLFNLIKVASINLFSRVYQGRSKRHLQN